MFLVKLDKIILHFFIITLFTFIYKSINIKDSNGNDVDWLDAFYYSVIVHTTVGFGDNLPKSKLGKIITICHALLVFIIGILI